MNRPKPINPTVALNQLLDEYERVSGKKPDKKVAMICEVSSERAMTQEWEWVKDENPNWPMRLEWK
jgi:hypothetical protein